MSTNNISKLLTALLTPVQDVENALQQLLTERSVDVAVGEQLDVLGRLVGQLRGGYEDDLFRRLIRARISVNRSKGTISDVLTVSELVIDDDTATREVDNQGMACVVLRILGAPLEDDIADILIKMLRDTVSAGVRIILEYSPVADPSTWFQWDTPDQGWDDGFFLNAID